MNILEVSEIERKLEEFEKVADIQKPQNSKIPFEVIGYGEISVVISIKSLENFVLKRLPIFKNYDECFYYKKIFDEYANILTKKVGISIPYQVGIALNLSEPVFYSVQEKLPKEWLGQFIFNSLENPADVQNFIGRVIEEIKKVCCFNSLEDEVYKIGIDAQLSNWALKEGLKGLSSKDLSLLYIDTSTPLIRENEQERLPADNFLSSTPPILKNLIKKLFMKEVLERYYDCRSIIIDFSSNLMNEDNKRNVKIALDFISSQEGISLQDIISYHKKDYIIWKTFWISRRIHRFFLTKLGRRYKFLIPPKISVKKFTKEDIMYYKGNN